MSFSFYVAAADPPRFSTVVELVGEPAWACAERVAEDDQFAPGYCFHPYVAGRSARGIELSHENGRFQVRILTCSSRADYELAVNVALALARLTGSPIEPEDGEAAPPDVIAREYGAAWIDKMVAWGADVVFTMIDRDGRTITLSGAKRDMHIGPRFAAELRARAGDMTPGEQLLAAMVRVQSVDEERYYPATAFRVTPQGRGADAAFTLAVWGPGVAYLMPAVDFFAVASDDGEVLVPHEAAPAVARGPEDDAHEPRWTWLDERNALVEATPPEQWDALVTRAKAHGRPTFHA